MREREDPELSALVGQASSGDPGAVHTLLARYLPALEGYVRRRTGPSLAQKESQSDLVQSVCREVLEDLARGAFEFRGEAPFRQWLFRAALHKIQMKGRYFQAQRRAGAREEPMLGDDASRAEPLLQSRTPSRAAVANEERERFLAALTQLPPAQRQVVEWAHLEGLPHQVIAQRLGITEANSRMLLSRALARLARLATR